MPQKIMPLTILTNALPDDSLILPDSPESINLDGDIIDNIVTLPMAIKEEEYIKDIKAGELEDIYKNRKDVNSLSLLFRWKDNIVRPQNIISKNFKLLGKQKNKLYFNEYTGEGMFLTSSIKLDYLVGIQQTSTEDEFIKLFYLPSSSDTSQIPTDNLESYINISLAKILSEVHFQKKAENEKVKELCNYNTTNIKQYGKINVDKNSEYVVFYILYNNISHLTNFEYLLDDYECPEIVEKISKIDKCLETNGIVHNDLTTPDNIYLDDKGNIYIIDYGEATTNRSKPIKSIKCKSPRYSRWSQAIGGVKTKKKKKYIKKTKKYKKKSKK
tara:strand:+ start:122 stop:1108 length:987 start_codon:yes stop_codon:yes gene_type:complete